MSSPPSFPSPSCSNSGSGSGSGGSRGTRRSIRTSTRGRNTMTTSFAPLPHASRIPSSLFTATPLSSSSTTFQPGQTNREGPLSTTLSIVESALLVVSDVEGYAALQQESRRQDGGADSDNSEDDTDSDTDDEQFGGNTATDVRRQ